MKFNMSAFETYLNNKVFSHNEKLVYESNGTPSLFCYFDKVEFRHDRGIINFYGGRYLTFVISDFDSAEVSDDNGMVANITIHTANNLFKTHQDINMWHFKQND